MVEATDGTAGAVVVALRLGDMEMGENQYEESALDVVDKYVTMVDRTGERRGEE